MFYNILILLILSSCSLIDKRDFEQEMDEFTGNDEMFVAGEDFELVSGDSGQNYRSYESILNRVPATEEDLEKRVYSKSLQEELVSMEEKLGEDEYNRYSSVSNILSSDSERIYFLSLTDEERRSYLELKGFSGPQRSIASETFQVEIPKEPDFKGFFEGGTSNSQNYDAQR